MGCAPPISAYVPGRTARHPEDAFAAIRDTVTAGMSIADIAASEAWRIGWTLFENGFFWEAHEVWEPVWMHLPPNSAERRFVQACIQLSNAALKERMERPQAALRLYDLTVELLGACQTEARIMGVDVADLTRRAKKAKRRLTTTAIYCTDEYHGFCSNGTI
ncbi:hypothetical protein AVO45_16035 [Ruegeria marisrubri]|uniref:DUF309 domain-containing protein n=1 Tax=Ruegeria marisrubri TaxID=1685379 RepID=A0A0X3TC95_9RHOB|nr:DUF309 domain-containing protein [Ruegeria marisrubri]KUJ73239.1 hypothetical protein AVO45_16035 [Ruegeria marisrubri]